MLGGRFALILQLKNDLDGLID